MPDRPHSALVRGMNLSLAVGFVLLIAKGIAAALTGSSAILSDAAESVVHVLAVGFASYSLRLAEKPADDSHHYGHDKVSFLSAGFEGAMVLAAAVMIAGEATAAWVEGPEVGRIRTGLVVTAGAAAVNLVLGGYLLRLGRRHRSIILVADGKHVLSDVLTSAGALVGLTLVLVTGHTFWDPLCALLVAANLARTGVLLARHSLDGLMDRADPETHETLDALFRRAAAEHGAGFHQLRHRHAGRKLWVDVHLTFDDELPLHLAHERATSIERAVRAQLPDEAEITTHLEPRDQHRIIHPRATTGPDVQGDGGQG